MTDANNKPQEVIERDEHYKRLLELKEKNKQLEVVIREGQYAEEFLKSSPFAPILMRTLSAMRENYNADAHKASKDSRSSISHFLGREECVKDILNIIDEFSRLADNAESEKKVNDDEMRELYEIMGNPEGVTQDVGGTI